MPVTTTQKSLATQLLQASNSDMQLATQALQQAHVELQNQRTARPLDPQIIIKVSDISRKYKVGKTQVEALKGVTLDIHKGEFIAITGTSGSGKSTLLHQIGGLDKPDGGNIEVNGQNLAKLSDAKLSKFRSQTIGFVFQFFYLQPFLNLQTNIEIPAMFARAKTANRRQRSAELATTVGLADRIKHLPRELSGGQMQRAAIARALQNSPHILLADEPTGNLDRENALAIFDLFQKIRDEQGTTVVVVTHDLELASRADRIISMSDGVIV